MAQREEQYIMQVRASARALFNSINELVAAQRQWNALDYLNTMGNESGAPAADVGAVVFDTANAMVTLLNQGSATNLAKLL